MNPEANEFIPQPIESMSKGAWSDPARSVHIAKLPRRKTCPTIDQEQKFTSVNSEAPLKSKAPPKPLRINDSKKEHHDENPWKTVGKKGNKVPIEESEVLETEEIDMTQKLDKILTEEELELKRKQRRERRIRGKETKRIWREQKKLADLRADKDTKINVIKINSLDKVRDTSKAKSFPSKARQTKENLRFFDEEYPSLGGNLESRSPKSIRLKNDSGSEWETEDESKSENQSELPVFQESQSIEIESKTEEKRSFTSILKKPATSPKISNLDNNPAIAELSDKINPQPVSKKVKNKDPITFDLFAALNVKKKAEKSSKNAHVLGSKIQPQSNHIRNALDASAPQRRRGKEREKPKKKRPTAMKKLIMLSRSSKKSLREANQELLKLTISNNAETEQPDDKSNTLKLNGSKDVEIQPEIKIEIVERESEINEPVLSLPEQSAIEKAKIVLHSRKFRRLV